jgi:excisionase family DNA binding protein
MEGTGEWAFGHSQKLLCEWQERGSSIGMASSRNIVELSKLLYSVAEAAKLLSVSRNTVYGLIRSGQIVAVYPTSQARISAGALARFVELKEAESRLLNAYPTASAR